MSSSQGVLFLRNVNGGSKWFEDGDEKNHGKYVGEIENGKPNGTGTIIYPDGEKYVGEWKNGKQHGQGKWIIPDGSKWVGEMRDGRDWNMTGYDEDGNIIGKYVNGVKQ